MRPSWVSQDAAPAVNLPHGELEGERGVIGLGQRQAGDRVLLLPHLPQPVTVPGVTEMLRSVPNHAAFWLAVPAWLRPSRSSDSNRAARVSRSA